MATARSGIDPAIALENPVRSGSAEDARRGACLELLRKA